MAQRNNRPRKSQNNGEWESKFVRKELEHFYIGDSCGGNQEWFPDPWMKIGGCGAVTACDVCIYLARKWDMRDLYPYDPWNVSKEEYLDFGMQMKKFLSPRMSGINKTEIYIEGFQDYLTARGTDPVRFEGVSGKEEAGKAAALIKERIDQEVPVPYLMLLHGDKKLDDYMWHWFILNGYDETDGHLRVSVVSYGKRVWMDFHHLWNTGRARKGGFVRILKKGSL